MVENNIYINLICDVGLEKGMSNLKYCMWEVSADAEYLRFKCFHKDSSKEIIILSLTKSTLVIGV